MNDPDRRQTSDGFDHDAMFADIVAHWNEAAEAPPGVPDQEAVSDDGAAGISETAETAELAELEPIVDLSLAEAGDDSPSSKTEPSLPPTIPAPLAWRAHEVEDDSEEHFEPPPIAPLPVGDLQFWAIIAGMGGGPLLLLYLMLFNRDAGSAWMFTAIAMSVGGFALLIARLPRDKEEDGDNGARL